MLALNQTPIDFKGNFENIIEAIQQAKNEKVCLLLLPELCITGYGCEDLFLSDWVYEKSMQVLLDILPYTSDIIVSVGLPVKIDNVNYNTSCVIFNQKIQGFTVKQFLANDGVHYEPRWFRPWRAGEQKLYVLTMITIHLETLLTICLVLHLVLKYVKTLGM